MKTVDRYSKHVIGAAVAALVVCGCTRRAPGPVARPPAPVRIAVAIMTNEPLVVAGFGTAGDQASVDVVPQVTGMLKKRLITDGAVVTNGQVLFEIEQAEYAAKVRQAEGTVAADEAQLALSQLSLARNKKLFEEKLVAPEVYDAVKTKVDAGEAQIRIDQAALDQARITLARCTIAAPLDGVCSKCYVDEGNLVELNKTKLTNIRSYDPIRVELSVSEENLPLVRRAFGSGPVPIEVQPRGDANTYVGTLVFMDNAVNTDLGTILLRGLVPNPNRALWAQQFVDVRIMVGVVNNAVMVPETAVQFGKSGPYVYVVNETATAEMRPTPTGLRQDGLIQVLSGVAAGEQVVVLGQLQVVPGGAVTVVGVQASASNTPPQSAGSTKQETSSRR